MKQTIMIQMITVLSNIISKIALLLSNTWTFISTLLLTFITFTAPINLMLIIISVLVIIDMLAGIWINRHHILSSRLRDTVVKLFFYIIIVTLAFSIENVLKVFILAPLFFSIISLIELISICANMSIILPEAKFFKIIRLVLKSEIIKKTSIDGGIIDKIIEEKDDK